MRPAHLRHAVCLATMLSIVASAVAIDLKTYYSKTNGKKAADLKTALYNTISSHTNIGYDGLLDAYRTTDRRADGYLRDWYSNATNYVIGGSAEGSTYKAEGDSYNREHLVPQSWFGSGLMKSDLMQVVPTDGYVNNRRGNYPLGENNGGTYKSANSYSKLGTCTVSGYSGQCFEPNDEVKGDIARIYFYVLACYQNLHPSWNGGTASSVFDGKAYPGLQDWTLKMFLRWAKQDPVDDVERARNEAVYGIQGNRNPFVDYPSLCEYVWGDSISYAFDPSLPHGQTTDNGGGDNGDGGENGGSSGGDDNGGGDDSPQDNPDATSGTVDFSQVTWTAATHPTYGAGFTTTALGLTISYYTYNSSNAEVTRDSEVRLYGGAVMLIEGAEVTGVVFHASDTKLSDVTIDGTVYSWVNKSTITWEGSMQPFMVTASGGQSRIKSLDITVKQEQGEVVGISQPRCNTQESNMPGGSHPHAGIYDINGKYIGPTLPLKKGTYVVRRDGRGRKVLVK